MQSKLPDEITAAIKSEATENYSDTHGFVAYTKGANAWAPWKVKYDELKDRCDKMAHLLYMLQSVHSHEWSEGNKENVKQTLQQWQQLKDGNKEKRKVCTCDNIQLAAHGECWGCPGRHTKLTNPTK